MESTVAVKSVAVTAVLEENASKLTTSQLSENSKNAMIAAAYKVLDLALSAVNEFIVDTNANGLSRIGVVLRFMVRKEDSPDAAIKSPAELFATVSGKLLTLWRIVRLTRKWPTRRSSTRR